MKYFFIFNLILKILGIHLLATLFGTLAVNLLLLSMTDLIIISEENIWETLKSMFFWITPVTVIMISTLKLIRFKR